MCLTAEPRLPASDVGLLAMEPQRGSRAERARFDEPQGAKNYFTARNIVVPVLHGVKAESAETFPLVLADPATAELTRATGDGQIVDDDVATTTNDDVSIYDEDFATGGGGFYNYVIDDGSFSCIPGEATLQLSPFSRAACRQYLPWVDGHLESRSPYWIDPNHRFEAGTVNPGLGFLNIVGFVSREPVPLNLTNARVTFRILLAPGFDFKGGHLSFWFQAGCDPRFGYTCAVPYADYIVDVPIETRVVPGQWSEVTLTPHEGDWRCLGAQTDTQGSYGCLPIEAEFLIRSFGTS